MRQWSKSILSMDTLVTIQVVSRAASDEAVDTAIDEALQAFHEVERVATRFQSTSEVMQLIHHVGEPTPVSPILFQQIRFALTVAEMTDGTFDPTVGHTLESAGFNRHYLSGEHINTTIDGEAPVTYKDVVLDESRGTVCLQKPLILDLGAVAKGFAVDLAARSLASFDGFSIDAGGDTLVSGVNRDAVPWRIGIRHPNDQQALWCTLASSDTVSICTSGTYERRNPLDATQHHIVNPMTGKSSDDLLSCTVVAPFAMMADALSTTAFILGAEAGVAFLEQCGVEGLFITSKLEEHQTSGMKRYEIWANT